MSLFDIAVAIVIGFSVISSLLKGMIRTVISLLAYIGGYFAGYAYKEDAASYLNNYVNHPQGAEILGFFVLFIGFSIIIKFIGSFIQKFMHETGDLSILDRILGAFLGAAIGIFIVAVIMIPIEFFPKFDEKVTMGSVSAPYLKQVSALLKQSMISNETIKKRVSELGLKNFSESLNGIKQPKGLQKNIPSPANPPSGKDIPQDNYSNASKKALEELLQTIQKQ